MKEDEIFRAFDRHNVEAETLSKYIGEYEQMWKWIFEFLSKFHGRGIKIARVNSILVAKPLIFFNILRAVTRQVTSLWAIVIHSFHLHLPFLSLYTLTYTYTGIYNVFTLFFKFAKTMHILKSFLSAEKYFEMQFKQLNNKFFTKMGQRNFGYHFNYKGNEFKLDRVIKS